MTSSLRRPIDPRRRASCLGIVLALVSAAPIARAEDPSSARNPAAAEVLFDTAKKLLRKGDVAAACSKFRASMELDPAVSTQLKIAKCHEHEGKFAAAWYDIQAALKRNAEETSPSEQRRRELDEFARAQLSALEPRVPKLKIVIAERPPGLRLSRGGEAVPDGSIGEVLPEDPGTVELLAEAPGCVSERRSVTLVEGRVTEVTFTLTREPTSAAASVPAPTVAAASGAAQKPSPEPRSPDRSAQRVAGLVLGGVGVVGLGVAGVLGAATLSKVGQFHDACPQNQCNSQADTQPLDQARSLQTGAFVALGAGAAVLGLGIGLYLTGKPRRAPVGLTTPPTFAFAPGLGGAALIGQW